MALIAGSSALSLDISPIRSDVWAWIGWIGCSFALYHYFSSLTKSNGTLNRGPASRDEQEFQQQLAAVPVKNWGYKIWMGLVAGLIGCSFALYHYSSLPRSNGTLNRGPAYGHTQEFRQQLADSVPVKGWGYKIQDVRFSEDYHKALVIFAVPGKTPVQDAVLEDDGFRRYKGSVRDYDKVAAAKPGDLATVQAWTALITVTLPDK